MVRHVRSRDRYQPHWFFAEASLPRTQSRLTLKRSVGFVPIVERFAPRSGFQCWEQLLLSHLSFY